MSVLQLLLGSPYIWGSSTGLYEMEMETLPSKRLWEIFLIVYPFMTTNITCKKNEGIGYRLGDGMHVQTILLELKLKTQPK